MPGVRLTIQGGQNQSGGFIGQRRGEGGRVAEPRGELLPKLLVGRCDQVRIDVQVSDVTTGFDVWSDQFRGTFDDVFDFQSATALEPEFAPAVAGLSMVEG